MIKFSVAFISCLAIVNAYSAGKIKQEISSLEDSLEVLAIDLNEIEHLKEWEIFKEQYSKQYGDAENELRKQIFLENKEMIEKHNKEYKEGKVSFEMGLNQYSDLSQEEFNNQMNGLIFDPNMNQASSFFFNKTLSDRDVPYSIDWVQKGFVTRVKNQKHCAACWAFSATGALEGQHFRKTGKLVPLSEQNLIDCSVSYGENGCKNGSHPVAAFEYVRKNGGIDTEKSYPYKDSNGQCRYSAKNKGATCKGYERIASGDEKALTRALAKIGPISVAIHAKLTSFHSYRQGIYNDKNCKTTNRTHAFLAVGYGTKNGQDYYLVKNSWGTSWGEAGYIKIARNAGNLCGIASGASYPMV